VRRLNGLALCAGIGGLELGLKLAMGKSYRTVCYVEREAFAAAVLVARMEDETLDKAPIWDDLTTFDGRAWRGVVDIVSAGFPCQPFSVAGKRRGVEDERWLWPDIVRIIGDVGPGVVFLENVPGLVHHGLRVVWSDLRRLGFTIWAGFFSASEIGAPHRRQRLFVLAHGDGEFGNSGLLDGEREAFGDDADGRHPTLPNASGSDLWDEPGRSGRASGPSEAEPGDVGEDLPNASSEQCGSRPQWRRGGGQIPTWPPPPGSGLWPRGLEPAVRRMADGPPYRMDQLRALGNGVVPLVAAHAWRTLSGT